jgi:hypothetical protein
MSIHCGSARSVPSRAGAWKVARQPATKFFHALYTTPRILRNFHRDAEAAANVGRTPDRPQFWTGRQSGSETCLMGSGLAGCVQCGTVQGRRRVQTVLIVWSILKVSSYTVSFDSRINSVLDLDESPSTLGRCLCCIWQAIATPF